MNDSESRPGVALDLNSSELQQQILGQLGRILAHESFRHSKRSARLLDYLVRETLAGHAEWLKERRIGVELFNRPADYDSNADPVVRATASEIRRRLAQYYHESAESEPIHIRLQPGSYSPLFSREPETSEALLPSPAAAEPEEGPAAPTHAGQNQAAGAPAASGRPRLLDRSVPLSGLLWALAVAALVAVAGLGFNLWREQRDPVRRFWLPMVHAGSTPSIVVGAADIKNGFQAISPFPQEMADQVNGLKEPAAETTLETRPIVMWQESEIAARVAQLLTEQHTRFQIRPANAVTLDDLRRGPYVLLGILDNPWAVRLLPRLRFHARMDPATQLMWIEDGEHPEQRQMSVHWDVPYSNSYSEYALITRCRDPLSGQPVMLIGGLGLHGTQAAGEYVANAEELARLEPALDNPELNAQVVLRVVVVNGAVAPAEVVAVHYWK